MTTPSLPRANARRGRAQAIALDSEGWLDLLWTGRWLHADGPEAADEADIRLTLANLEAEANAAGADWPGIPFYIGHPEMSETLDSAPAVGWAKRFRINAAGRLQGLVEWAGDARAELVDSRRYKFVSCYEWGDLDDQGTFHTAYLSSVALTNNPVKRDGQKPLANANAGAQTMPDSATPPELHAELLGRANAIGEDVAARVAELIGTAATKEDALDAIYRELRRVWSLESQLDAMATLVSTMANAAACTLPEGDLQARCNALAEAVQAVCTERDEMAVAEAVRGGAVPDTEQGRANALRLLHADREAAQAHFANAARRPAARRDPLAGNPPRRANSLGGDEPAEDFALAAKIVARANALMAECGNNWDRAFARATKEISA